ncbi:MAG: hypothetical protein GXP55_22240 [Deltaproteobacteria bacterium]|nr:hypothetical protein [Deltaproteobacteria bacterium]
MPSLGMPLPIEALPAKLRRFAQESAPKPARMMAAKGLVPLGGAELVTLLCQLAAATDRELGDTAGETLQGLPEAVLLEAAEQPLPAPVLHALAEHFSRRPEVLERVVQNSATEHETVVRIARHADERLTEIIAVNQERLLAAPTIIEALYKNRNTRMSTADRIVEFAARHELDLKGIPSFRAHVEAIRGQLIPEPTEESLPGDTIFQEALAADSDEDAIDLDAEAEAQEKLKEKFKPLAYRIREMNAAEKIRLATIGDAAARALLIRDPNRTVSHAAISSPSLTENEASAFAHSKEISEDILRYIGNRREWLRSYEIKRALTFNPKTPTGVALRFISHLRPNDLKLLAKSRSVTGAIKTAASHRLEAKEKKRKH